ncbi:hypothetical protein [Croceivirga thetidis]|uniref:PH domain-containing protein n=1 Tax=Croceivirga thetidis TaxID=2721623 RepID=A0ABX1GX51_9FLAO|nr:hypothetical protein [Croceivirga thetidis]NKI33450.1 hypothetical protein [Croceivirga thetidis]
MREFKETQWFSQWWMQLINFGLLGLLGYFYYQWYVAKEAVDKVGVDDTTGQIIVTVALLIGFGITYIFRLYTRIDETGIHYKFFPFHFTEKSISWYDVEKCHVRKYQPITEYGGWGIKFMPGGGGRVYSTKGNMGVQLELKNGKKVLFGTQKPEEAQKILGKYFKN